MQKTFTKERLQNHLTYGWWKYVLLIAAALMGWSIFYSVTAYRPPEEKKVVVGVYAAASEKNMHAYMEQMHAQTLPDMEEVSAMYILPDAQYGETILATRMAARECDLYILPKKLFQGWAAEGAFLPLDSVAPELVARLTEGGLSLSRGWRTQEIDEYTTDPETGKQVVTQRSVKELYGIPLADFPEASALLGCDASDMYLSVFCVSGNDENALLMLEILVDAMLNGPAAPAPTAAPAE